VTRRILLWIGICALALPISACNRTVLNYEKALEIGPGGQNTITIEPAPREQKIKVDFTAAPNPVSVFVCLEKDQKAVEHDIETRKEPVANVLARADKADKGILDVTVPADNRMIVLVTRAAKTTKVTLKITN
jgi:hypothetical protein